MDASASKNVDADIYWILSIGNSEFPNCNNSKHKNTAIKYTKIPDFDLDSKGPRTARKPIVGNTSNRAVGPEYKQEKNHRNTTRLSNTSKISRESKHGLTTPVKNQNTSKVNFKSNSYRNPTRAAVDNIKCRNVQEKEPAGNTKCWNTSSKISVSKNLVSPNDSKMEMYLIKQELLDNLTSTSVKKPKERTRVNKNLHQNKSKVTMFKEITESIKPVTVIHVPLDEKCYNRDLTKKGIPVVCINKVDCCTDTDNLNNLKEANVGTDPVPETVDQVTGMNDFHFESIKECQDTVKLHVIQETFDSLKIPNVALTKDKSDISKEKIVNVYSQSLPNLQVPELKVSPNKEEIKNESTFCKSASFIIGRATVTYTTRQKINFHVVGSSDETSSLSPSPLSYPMNVMSVFKKEIQERNSSRYDTPQRVYKKINKSCNNESNSMNEIKSLNCSYVFNSHKLVKPSDIISTIQVNNGLLPSDYICEQFQRELNFIDSFFESLQCLENCSSSYKYLKENNVESWVSSHDFDVKNSEYGSFLSKIEDGGYNYDSETMASKSLCLLNLLIRNEQRRAKNLLFVLKMREDALKDFTKSQIIWLENKKKQENTDISTLKKKQRGALVKLQHECGEMQRMRKALLTLTEKRKVALMKTKKNIELKLNNNVDVDKILLGKKKIKRNPAADRNMAPLKCFDLSSSGCDDSAPPSSRQKSDITLEPDVAVSNKIASAEKCVQTGDSILGQMLDQSTDTAAENFVVVDGTYLNILFHNLRLPQIFSSGKQYEVNEEALKNIVNSTNSHNAMYDSDVVEKFMDQVKNRDLDRSSSPSTARSLVEEMDQYYKGLAEEDKSVECVACESNTKTVEQVNNSLVHADEHATDKGESYLCLSATKADAIEETELSKSIVDGSLCADRQCGCKVEDISLETPSLKGKNSAEPVNQAGPLPVPAGADISEVPAWIPVKSSSTSLQESSSTSSQICSSISITSHPSVTSLTVAAHCEAEELRRQQLAIEREIKALEQQQCQLLVLREIPDKPPPPYTPPADYRSPRQPRKFIKDEETEEKIERYLETSECSEPSDVFDFFVRDFCQEMLERQRSEQSDMPWDACNLLPQKSPVDADKLVKKTSSDLVEVLSCVVPAVVSGVGGRRSDHIDDILFAEWRRCEPEWTSLHTDEAVVKNQLFESIFQKVLTETVDEYKRTVLTKH